MVDDREFFAEFSVAFWSQHYQELDTNNRTHMLQSSPPFLEPTVRSRLGITSLMNKVRMPHCNKFYPFTRGQLRYYDAETCALFEQLWSEISDWDDPFIVETNECYCSCWHPFQSNGKKNNVLSMDPVMSDTVEL